MSLPYVVPGLVEPMRQPNDNACWATAYTILKSWKEQRSLDIRSSVEAVDSKYSTLFDAKQGLPASEFGPFLAKANLQHLAMINLSIAGWEQQLRSKGLVWVGSMASLSTDSMLHSRILEGMSGNGSPAGTNMSIVDPGNGTRYVETFASFIAKYEEAVRRTGSDEYYQIRFFP